MSVGQSISPQAQTVRNRLLEAIKNRLEEVVANYYIRFNFDESSMAHLLDIQVDGENISLLREYSEVFKCTFLPENKISIQKFIDDEETAVGEAEVFELVDGVGIPIQETGRNLIIGLDGLSEFPEGESFEIHLGNRIFSIRGVYRWDRIVTNKVSPSIVVFPYDDRSQKIVSDRVDSHLRVSLTLWVESEPEAYSQLEEYIGEILSVLMREEHFGDCLNYDSEITNIRIVDADGVSEAVGAYIELLVKYRYDLRDPRVRR